MTAITLPPLFAARPSLFNAKVWIFRNNHSFGLICILLPRGSLFKGRVTQGVRGERVGSEERKSKQEK
ncbi:hypothetical protein OAV27_02060 [Euryarchaeota archaeon]|nr:hypothetical protein [Euryarchaeota archaeon]